MTPEELIASGKLELYVYGALPKEEHDEVYEMSKTSQEINEEIQAIEASLYRLSSYVSPYLSARNYERIKLALKLGSRNMNTGNRLFPVIGYAASLLFLLGLGYFYYNNSVVTTENQVITDKNKELETTVAKISSENELLNEIRKSDYTRVTLDGLPIAPESDASIYWDKETHKVIVDVKNLPEPPTGKVYQVWSLVLVPNMLPTSIGVLDEYRNSDLKIFEIENVDYAEAFGITLEPEGGSKTPTLDQLYTLGKV